MVSSLSTALVVLLAGTCHGFWYRADQPSKSLKIECGSQKTNLMEHADFIGPKVWEGFCRDLDHAQAKTETIKNAKGDITLSYTPSEGKATGKNDCVVVFQSLAGGCADETWEGPDSSASNDVRMFNSGTGEGECGTFAFHIAA